MSEVKPPLLPQQRRRRRNRIALSIVFVLLALPFAVFIGWRLSLANEIRALEQKARDAGEPITLAELAATQKPVREEENAAVALMNLWEEDDPAYWRAFNSGEKPLPQRQKRELATVLKQSGSGESKAIAPLPWDDGQVAAAKAAVLEEDVRFRRLTLAVARPKCLFPVKVEDGLHALLLHLSPLRDEVRHLQVRSLLAVHDHNYDSAFQSIELMHRLAELLRNDTSLISQLVRVDGFQRVFQTAEQMLSFGDLSPKELARLSLVTSRANIGDAYHRSLLAERVLGLSIFSRPIGDLDMLGSGEAESGGHSGLFKRMTIERSPFNWFGYFDLDRRFLLQTYEQVIALSRNGTAEGDLEAAAITGKAAAAAKTPPFKIVTGLMLPALRKAGEKLAGVEARRRCLMVAIKVEEYRRLHRGALPDSLELLALADPILGTDPFAQSPLNYLRESDRFVVYSIGPDMSDDLGQLQKKSAAEPALDLGIQVLLTGRSRGTSTSPADAAAKPVDQKSL